MPNDKLDLNDPIFIPQKCTYDETEERSGTTWINISDSSLSYPIYTFTDIDKELGNAPLPDTFNNIYIEPGTLIESKRINIEFADTKEIMALLYVSGTDKDGNQISGYIKPDNNLRVFVDNYNINTNPPKKETTQDQVESSRAYVPNTGIFDYVFNNANIEDSEFVKLENVLGVFGLPYQFLPTTDTRLDNSVDSGSLGYEYAAKIVERIPLLFISPGKASYLNGYSQKDKETITGAFTNPDGDQSPAFSAIRNIVNGEGGNAGRYYTFEYDVARYYRFVNPMCRIAARYLELQDFRLDKTPLDKINWMDYIGSHINSITDVIQEFLAIPFYMDAETSVSESFSNNTTSSMLASTVNGLSDTARELNFLLGYSQSAFNLDIIRNNAEIRENEQILSEWIKEALGNGNFVQKLAKTVSTVATGGKMIFPEIWSDSSFSKSYNCKFKFVSPDPSTLSVYLNVLVPLFHLIGLVAPQSLSNDPNTYVNPFLVRAIYKGHFNVDMGIITDMNITKGDECQWTIEGIPTSIEVSLTIKDLYQTMSITQTGGLDDFDTLDNTAQMDYIANLCGINIYKPEIARIVDMWLTNNISNRASDLFNVSIWGNIQNKVQNSIMGIFR